MTYASNSGLIGQQPVTDIFVPDTTQRFPLGQIMHMVDSYWGGGGFVYAKAVAAQEAGSLCYPALDWAMTDIPNTAGTGLPIYVAKAAMIQDSYGWYQYSGLAPMSAQASVAAGTVFGITAAGQIGAVAAGKQVLGARILGASTYTDTWLAQTQNGSGIIKVNTTDGIFIGLTMSGTGIPASTEVSGIDSSQNQITVNNNCTATGGITMTGTYTGYVLATFNSPFVQGQIV